MKDEAAPVVANPWQALRRHTDARIALGRAGISQPTSPQLAFQAAHAQARDAVHLALDIDALRPALLGLGLGLIELHSAAATRQVYLQRPDLGRKLHHDAAAPLEAWAAAQVPAPADGRRVDLVIALADGLSALALHRQALPVLSALLPRLQAEGVGLAPLIIVRQGRVAVGDEVGQRLGARQVLVLIGERPGLSSPDSLGAYLTWAPTVGLSDAARNCVSNIRPAGLAPALAAQRLAWLLGQSRARRLSGVALKDESDSPEALAAGAAVAIGAAAHSAHR